MTRGDIFATRLYSNDQRNQCILTDHSIFSIVNILNIFCMVVHLNG